MKKIRVRRGGITITISESLLTNYRKAKYVVVEKSKPAGKPKPKAKARGK